MSAWVIVDDSDPTITYTGSWIPDDFAPETNSLSEDIAFNLTAHSVSSLAGNASHSTSSFFFAFNGTKIAIFGLDALFNTSGSASQPVRTGYECFIDDTPISSNSTYSGVPSQSYCETDALSDGLHEFEFRVDSGGVGLWFDFLRYMPSSAAGAVPPGSMAWYGATDVQLPSGNDIEWKSVGSAIMNNGAGDSSESGASLTPVFSMIYFGGSFAWYGLSKAALELTALTTPTLSLSSAPSSNQAFYAVDNDAKVAFTVDLSTQTVGLDVCPYNTALFIAGISGMPPAMHSITVFHDMKSTTSDNASITWPLTLAFITIEDAFDGPPGSSSSPGSISGTGSGTGGKRSVAAIVSGVLGGLFLVLCVLGFFGLRRWRIHRRRLRRANMTARLAQGDIKLRPFFKSSSN